MTFILSQHDYIYDAPEEKFEKRYEDTRSWLVMCFQEKADLEIFSIGFGDSVYPSFWGLDENGEPACLVTDFLIMD